MYFFSVFRVPKPSSYGSMGAGGDRHPCCGSRAPSAGPFPVPTAPFERFAAGGSFFAARGVQYLVRNGEPGMVDAFPPGRVTDLRVAGYYGGKGGEGSTGNGTAGSASLLVTLEWTAPGGDLVGC